LCHTRPYPIWLDDKPDAFARTVLGVPEVMTKQRGEDSPPQPSSDDTSPGEFIDKPDNLPGDQDKTPAPKSA
jgi:hypothetical protein